MSKQETSQITVDENGTIVEAVAQITSNYGYGGRDSMELTFPNGKKEYIKPRTPKEQQFYQSLGYKMYVKVRRDSSGRLYVPDEPYQKRVDFELLDQEIANRLLVIDRILEHAEYTGIPLTMDHAINLSASIMHAAQTDKVFYVTNLPAPEEAEGEEVEDDAEVDEAVLPE